MSKYSPEDRLRHILAECDFLIDATRNLAMADFVLDARLRRACERSFEIIGEAAKNVPEDFRKKHPQVDWRKICGMRDVIIHNYSGVDYQVIYRSAINRIPLLKAAIEKILQEEC